MLPHSTSLHHPLHDQDTPAEDWFSAQGFLDLYTENGEPADADGEVEPAYHLGEDLNFGDPGDDANEEVYAVASGTIVEVGNYGAGVGDYIVAEHEVAGKSFSAVYGHIDIAPGLGVGSDLESDLEWGKQIGTLHDYSADHLHFAVADGSATGVKKGYTDATTKASATIGLDGIEYVFENELGVTKFLDPVGFFETYGAEPDPDGGSSFSVGAGETYTAGVIPAGSEDTFIDLSSSSDIDLELWAGNTPLVGFGTGAPLGGGSEESFVFDGAEITYSGYGGDGSGAGEEYIEIDGAISEDLTIKVTGFQAGAGTVAWSADSIGGGEPPTPDPDPEPEPGSRARAGSRRRLVVLGGGGRDLHRGRDPRGLRGHLYRPLLLLGH